MLDERIAFLNHGSFGAVPRCVFDEQTEWRRRIEAEPVEILSRRREELLDSVKREVGDWLGMRPGDFGFVTNATEGINAVLRSIEWKPGDELLTTNHVYHAVRQAMRYVAGRCGASYREIEIPLPVASSEQVERLVLNGLSARTRLLVIDQITSPTALIFPAERIVAGCVGRGVDVLLDGAHAPGMVPLNVERLGATYYCGNLHKWTCAPRGSGFLWVTPERRDRIHPLVISHYLGEGFTREFGWQGTRELAAWLSIPRALRFMSELGWERVMAHNRAMALWAQANLCERWSVAPIGPPEGSMTGSMVSLPAPAHLSALDEAQTFIAQQKLYSQYRVEAPFMRWDGRVLLRPCFQVYNTPDDGERLAEAILKLR
jgi:isopenicillin-N epimerase